MVMDASSVSAEYIYMGILVITIRELLDIISSEVNIWHRFKRTPPIDEVLRSDYIIKKHTKFRNLNNGIFRQNISLTCGALRNEVCHKLYDGISSADILRELNANPIYSINSNLSHTTNDGNSDALISIMQFKCILSVFPIYQHRNFVNGFKIEYFYIGNGRKSYSNKILIKIACKK